MSDLAGFKKFFAEYVAAIKKGDAAALRKTLPPGIGDDHVAFLMQVNQGMFGQIEAAGVEPKITEKKGFIELAFEYKDVDGEQTVTRPFWWHQGQWVTFDPANPDA